MTTLAKEGIFYRRILPSPPCIDFSSEYGMEIFTNALIQGNMRNYFQISPQFRTQDEPAYCGITTLCMSLNALMVDPGKSWKNSVWRWYEESRLDCCVSLDLVKKQGITLDEFACLSKCNGCNIVKKRVSSSSSSSSDDDDANSNNNNKPSSLEEFRNYVKEISKVKNKVLVISYNRKTLGQTGSGHFSPISGYEEEQDLVLILDVARFKYPPHWVKLDLVHEAMCGIDSSTGKSRGYVILEKNNVQEKNVLSLNLSANTYSQIKEIQMNLINMHSPVGSNNNDDNNNINNNNNHNSVNDDMKNISIQIIDMLSKYSNIIQYVYVMRTSSCCSNVDPTHLKKAEDVKQRIEGTKLYNIMAEYKKHNKMDVQKCCHKKAQANCIHFAIMLLLSLSVDMKDGTTKQQVNIDIVNLLIKEKIIEYDELLTLEAIQLKEQIDELLKDATLFSRNKNNKEEEQTCC